MAKKYIEIGGTDLSQYMSNYKVDYNVLVKDTGRNARGDLTLSVVNRKYKLNVTFRPTNEDETQLILNTISPFVMTINFWDPETKSQQSGTFYTSTAMPDMMWDKYDSAYYEFGVNFIEL